MINARIVNEERVRDCRKIIVEVHVHTINQGARIEQTRRQACQLVAHQVPIFVSIHIDSSLLFDTS